MWELDQKAGWALKNWCFRTVVLENTLESLLDSKEINSVNPKGNQPWIFIGMTGAEALILWPPAEKKTIHWKRPCCWERLRAEGEGGDRGWDGCLASLAQWTWVWASSSRWWRTGKPDVLQSMGSQKVGHDWATHSNDKEVNRATALRGAGLDVGVRYQMTLGLGGRGCGNGGSRVPSRGLWFQPVLAPCSQRVLFLKTSLASGSFWEILSPLSISH